MVFVVDVWLFFFTLHLGQTFFRLDIFGHSIIRRCFTTTLALAMAIAGTLLKHSLVHRINEIRLKQTKIFNHLGILWHLFQSFVFGSTYNLWLIWEPCVYLRVISKYVYNWTDSSSFAVILHLKIWNFTSTTRVLIYFDFVLSNEETALLHFDCIFYLVLTVNRNRHISQWIVFLMWPIPI